MTLEELVVCQQFLLYVCVYVYVYVCVYVGVCVYVCVYVYVYLYMYMYMYMYMYKHQKATINQIIFKFKENSRNIITQFQMFCHKPFSNISFIYLMYIFLICRHEFHKSCVDPWLLEHRTCPICKTNILKAFGIVSYTLLFFCLSLR